MRQFGSTIVTIVLLAFVGFVIRQFAAPATPLNSVRIREAGGKRAYAIFFDERDGEPPAWRGALLPQSRPGGASAEALAPRHFFDRAALTSYACRPLLERVVAPDGRVLVRTQIDPVVRPSWTVWEPELDSAVAEIRAAAGLQPGEGYFAEAVAAGGGIRRPLWR